MQLHQNSLGIKQHKTAEAIEWFANIKRNNECTFIPFDIWDVYPSITENLKKSVINQAMNYCPIIDHKMYIIKQAQKSILHNFYLWTKRSNPGFSIAMGAYDVILTRWNFIIVAL